MCNCLHVVVTRLGRKAQSKDQAGCEGPKPQTAVYCTRYQTVSQAHAVHPRRGVARVVVHVSAVRLTVRGLGPLRRPLFHSTLSVLSAGGLLLTPGCLPPRCSSFPRLRLSGGRGMSPAAGHRRYIPASTLPNRGRGTGGMPQRLIASHVCVCIFSTPG